MARYLYKDSIVILQYITGIFYTIATRHVFDPHSVDDIKFNLNYNTGELSIRSQNEIQRAGPAKSQLYVYATTSEAASSH